MPNPDPAGGFGVDDDDAPGVEADANGDEPAGRAEADAKGEEVDANEPNVVGVFLGGACAVVGVDVTVASGSAASTGLAVAFSDDG